MSVNTYRIEDRACPYCGYEFDHATAGVRGQETLPGPRAILICIKCAGVFTPTDKGPLKKLDVESAERTMTPDTRRQFRHALAAVRRINEPLN